MQTYSMRRNLLEKAEWEWRLTPDALVARDHHGKEHVGRWADVVDIRLSTTPTQYASWRHATILTFRNRKTISVSNAHFAGVGNFEDRSATYGPFVREIIARVRANAPNARGRIGIPAIAWWSTVIPIGLLFAFLAALLVAVPVGEFPGAVWLKLGLIALMLPLLFLWVRKTRPRRMSLDAVPEEALPRAA